MGKIIIKKAQAKIALVLLVLSLFQILETQGMPKNVIKSTKVANKYNFLNLENLPKISQLGNIMPLTVKAESATPDVDLSESYKEAIDLNGGNFERGDGIKYVIHIINGGTQDVGPISVIDDIPANLNDFELTIAPEGSTYNSYETGGLYNNGYFEVVIPNLEADTEAEVHYTAILSSNLISGQTITNKANIIAPELYSYASATPDVTLSVQNTPFVSDISITKEVTDLNGGTFYAGETLEYRIKLINNTGATLDNLLINDPLNSYTNYTSNSIKINDLLKTDVEDSDEVTVTGDGINVPQNLKFSLSNIQPNAEIQIKFQVTGGSEYPNGSIVTNKAVLTFNNVDKESNETQLQLFAIPSISKISITKNATDLNGGIFYPEDVLEYKIRLINNTGATLENVVIDDSIDNYTQYKSSSISINNLSKTDVSDSDEATVSGNSTVPQNYLRFLLGNVQASADIEIKFQVTGGAGQANGVTVKNEAFLSFTGASKVSNTTQIQLFSVPSATTDTPAPIYGGGSDRPFPGTYDPLPPAIQPAEPTSSTATASSSVSTTTSNPIFEDECNCGKQPIYYQEINRCLIFDPSNAPLFNDVNEYTQNSLYINALKNTKFLSSNEYLLSGSKKIAEATSSSNDVYNFDPMGLTERYEVIRLALISNCIAIEENIKRSDVPYVFSDLDLNFNTNNEKTNYVAKIMYTGLKYGIVFGYSDNTARAFAKASTAEALVIMSRAAKSLPWDFESDGKDWFSKYSAFAIDNKIIDRATNLTLPIVRQNLAKIMFKVMAYNPDSRINSYIDQIDLNGQRFVEKIPVYKPLNQSSECEQKCSQANNYISTNTADDQLLHANQLQNSCLQYRPDRNLKFNDINNYDWGYTAVNFFKNTQIKELGDYVFSGHGNHSTGKQQAKYQTGKWQFQSTRFATRLEVVKTALVANCITIEDELPMAGKAFKDLSRVLIPGDDLGNFEKKVFYTALKYGIIEGFSDGTARPSSPVTRAEALAIYLRTTQAVPEWYTPSVKMKDVKSSDWYYRYIAYAVDTGLINLGEDSMFRPHRQILRNEMSQILLRSLFVSNIPQVRDYAEGSIEKLPSEYIWYALHKMKTAIMEGKGSNENKLLSM